MKKLTNGRVPVHQSMPPLTETCAAFTGFVEGEKRSDRMFELLAGVIQRHRRAVPQRFYTMREVAKFFGVPLDAVAKIYRRLDRQGVLTLVRSSQTMIAARSPRLRFAIRGVVCMPIWLPAFLQYLDYRTWFSQMEEEISHYRFVVEPIFYNQSEEINPEFVDRVLQFNPDYVLWYCPIEADAPTMLSIADTGVQMVVIQNSPGQFPGRIYRISYSYALRKGLKEWKAGGEINNIVVPQRPGETSATMVIKSALKACGLPYQFVVYPEEKSTASLLEYLRRLAPDGRTGIIFDDDLFYARLCMRMPEMVLNFFTQNRVMVMRKVTIPCSATPGDATVDALLFPWKRLARRIAMDLSQAKKGITSEQSVFQAEWHPRLALTEVMQHDFAS